MPLTRRQMAVRAARSITAGAVAGSIWYQLLRSQATAHASMLRPPGALDEQDFLGRCIKCGNCVSDCPFDTLKLARLGRENTPGTPFYEARQEPCHMCTDIPCIKSCPTGALDPELQNINESKMGLAEINEETCLAYLGLRCEICYRVCPKIGKAVTLRYRSQERTGKHAYLEPVIHQDECTGCGMCEHACPTDEASVRVLPRSLVFGSFGRHYRLGWKDRGVITRDFEPGAGTPAAAPGSREKALNTLNRGGKLYD